MKATITFEETTPGNLDVKFEFDPPIDKDTKESVVTTAVHIVMEALKAHAKPVEKTRIITDLHEGEIITP